MKIHPKKTEKRRFGDLGEEIATKYLSDRGFVVTERNYLKTQGEIDIIARKAKSLHFIEVKTVSWDSDAHKLRDRRIRPEENIHKNKLARLFRAVQIYLLEKGIGEQEPWQIDAVFVFLDQKRKKSAVEYYEHISLG